MTAEEVASTLRLEPHPEGGSTARPGPPTPRLARGSAANRIYLLLQAGETSRWHRVDAAETWHFQAGAALLLSLSADEDGPEGERRLGPDLMSGEAPQVIVPSEWWHAARSTGEWMLIGCTVSPGFRFEGFELAPYGFDIPRRG